MIEINRFQNIPLRSNQINNDENPNRQLSDVDFLITMLREGGPTDKPPLSPNQQPSDSKTTLNKPTLPLVNEVTKQDHVQLLKLIEAEKLRSTGAASATDELLGLNQKPSIVGTIAPPPGNNVALRYITPVMRRMTIRDVLTKQRKRTRNLANFLRSKSNNDENSNNQNNQENEEDLITEENNLFENYKNRAVKELDHTVQMLNLLGDLLAMQDQALSQMASFSKG